MVKVRSNKEWDRLEAGKQDHIFQGALTQAVGTTFSLAEFTLLTRTLQETPNSVFQDEEGNVLGEDGVYFTTITDQAIRFVVIEDDELFTGVINGQGEVRIFNAVGEQRKEALKATAATAARQNLT